MFEIPQLLSLSSQAAAAIQRGIAEGVWTEFLPSERRFCELFHISRPTVRAALHLLAKEGLITIRQGSRNRVIAARPRVRRAKNRLVAIVTHEPVSLMPTTAYQSIMEMRSHLLGHGFSTEILVCPVGNGAAPRRKLEEFARDNRILCCVLIGASRGLQQWFVDRGIAALVVGSCHDSVRLPSLDVDYRSVCRHAAGIFIAKGHRKMAFIVPDLEAPGDLASEQGFLDGAACRTSGPEVRALIVRHKGTAQHIGAKLDNLFNSPFPPTALLVAKPQHVFMVLIYLLKHGLAVPDTVSIIARDHDNLLAHVSPPISHYSFKGAAYEHRLTRLMLQMLEHGTLPPVAHLLFPRFFAGGTVKSLAGRPT